MVAPIRDLGNITQSSAIMSNISLNSASSQDIDMFIDPIGTLFDLDSNYDEVRGHSLNLSTHRPRSPSMSLSKCNKEYHIHVK